MIRVGIMSMQRIINYGSFLQSYGLKKTLEALGHDVEFVDFNIEPCLSQNEGRPSAKARIRKLIIGVIRKCYHIVFYSYRKKKMQAQHQAHEAFTEIITTACNEHLGITETRHCRNDVDVLVIGSDEVFNCLNSDGDVGYSPELFAKDARASKVISYAASFGATTYEGLCDYNITGEVAGYLDKFDAISVRDKNSGSIVEKLLHREPHYHLDPVLIYPFDEELCAAKPLDLKDYIVVYAYSGRVTRTEGYAMKRFAARHKKKLIALAGYQSFCESVWCTPFEVLRYFKHADYVFTDTFHGTVLSIKYNKAFATFVRDEASHKFANSQKVYDLLERFSLTGRVVDSPDKLEQVILADVDFTDANQKIEKERTKSREYLKNTVVV